MQEYSSCSCSYEPGNSVSEAHGPHHVSHEEYAFYFDPEQVMLEAEDPANVMGRALAAAGAKEREAADREETEREGSS